MYRAGLVLSSAVFIVGILEWLLFLLHYTEFLEKIAPWLGRVSPTRIWVTISVGIVLFFIAWMRRKEELSGTSEHESVPPSGGITQTANPSFSQSGATQKVEIHNYPPVIPPSLPKPPEKEVVQSPTHNVVFQGARRIKFDLEMTREINGDQSGIIAVKACFLNRSIPGKRVSDFNYATAHVVYRTALAEEVAETSKVAWVGPYAAKYVHFRVNRPECIVLAFWGDQAWLAPYVTWRKSFFDWEVGNQTELDGVPLPFGDLAIEITLADGTGIGLEPVFVYLNLGPNGAAKIK